VLDRHLCSLCVRGSFVRTVRGLRSLRSCSNEINVVAVAEIDEHEGMDEASLREHEEVTKVKNISTIEMSRFVMDTWYFSPYPKSVVGEHVDILYLCEFTFKFYLSKSAMLRDQVKS